jgi:hypothetical protein
MRAVRNAFHAKLAMVSVYGKNILDLDIPHRTLLDTQAALCTQGLICLQFDH